MTVALARSSAVLLATGIFLLGCESGATRPSPVTGTDASADAARVEPPAEAGSPLPDARPQLPDAPPPVNERDGEGCTVYDTPRPELDAGETAIPSDAATPPTHCIAPCIWELMKDCLPEGESITQSYPHTVPPFGGSVTCAPENDWWSVTTSYPSLSYGSATRVYAGDRLCYTISTNCTTCGWGGTPATITQWGHPGGGFVGLSHDREKEITCGRYVSLATASQVPPEDVVTYPQDHDSPDCARWLPPRSSHRSGCCGQPPAIP